MATKEAVMAAVMAIQAEAVAAVMGTDHLAAVIEVRTATTVAKADT